MSKSLVKNDKAISEIYASVILIAIVFIVGTSEWNFVSSVGNVLENSYFSDIKDIILKNFIKYNKH